MLSKQGSATDNNPKKQMAQGGSVSSSSVGTIEYKPLAPSGNNLVLPGSRPQTQGGSKQRPPTSASQHVANARKMRQKMRDLEAVIPTQEQVDGSIKVPHNAKNQESAPITGWVLDFSEAESAQREPLQINGIGTGIGAQTLKSAQTVANLDIVPVDYWKSQTVTGGRQTPSQKYRQRNRPMIPMTLPDRSGSLEDALVIKSKAALKRHEKEIQSSLPIHQQHTVASQGKLNDSPQKAHHSIHVDEPRRYEGGNNSDKKQQDLLNSSEVSSQKSDAPKGLLKLKIVEFHSQQTNSDQRKPTSRNIYSNDIIHEVSCSNGSVEIEMHPDGKIEQQKKMKITPKSGQSRSLPYSPSHKRLPQRGPTVVEFGSLVSDQQENDENKAINRIEDFEAEASHRMQTAYKNKKGPHSRPMTSSTNNQQRDPKSQTLCLVPYKSNESRIDTISTIQGSSTQQLNNKNPRRTINPQVADAERIQRYHQIQRPFSVKNTRYNFQGQPPLPKPQSSQQVKRMTTLSSGGITEENDIHKHQSSIFQTQLYQPVETIPVSSSTNLLDNYRTLQPQSTQSFKSGTFSQTGNYNQAKQDDNNSELTREQIFNYLQNKKKVPSKAPYGVIQRDTDILDDQQRQIDIQRQALIAAANTLPNPSMATAGGSVNYINIFMQQPAASTLSLSPQPKNLRSSMDPFMVSPQEQTLETVLDHTNQQFLQQLDQILKKTPLQDILKEGIDKEKKKVPQFLYFHNQGQGKDDQNLEGDDIGFEDNNMERDKQSRVQAKLLDTLLQDILTGKFRDTHWFSGIKVHRETETHWLNGALRDKTEKYIDGTDLAILFREKLQPHLFKKKRMSSSSPRLSSPRYVVQEVDDPSLESSPAPHEGKGGAIIPYKENRQVPLLALTQIESTVKETPQITIIDTEPLKDMLQSVNNKVSEHKEIQMDHIYEMNKQRFDDQVVSTYIQSDRLERGKKDVQGAPKAIEDEETAKSRKIMQLGQENHKHTMGTLEKAKEHYVATKEKHKKELESMGHVVDKYLQFPGQRAGVSSTSLGIDLSPRRSTSARKRSPRGKSLQKDFRMKQRTMIYTCFLELVRQIGARQKDQGVLLLKIWHAYFDQFDHELDRIVASVKSKQREVDHILAKMKEAFGDLIKQKEHTEQRFFDLNLRIEELQKDLNVSRLIQKRDGELRKEATDNFDRMKNLFPRCEEYLEKIKLNEIESTRTDVNRLRYLCKKLKKPMPNEVELPLILDLDLIMSSIKSKTCHVMNAMYEHELLAGTYEQFKLDTQAKFSYMESLLIEKEEELRQDEERRFTAEDRALQTDMLASEIQAMQTALSNPPQIETKGRRHGMRSNYNHSIQGMHSQKIAGIDGESPTLAQISNAENGSPLVFEQRMHGVPQTPSVNVTPYELFTPGQDDNMFSTAKKKGKLPKKNLVSSVAQSISKGKTSKGNLESPEQSSQMLASKEKRGSMLVTHQASNLLKLNPIGNDSSPEQDQIALRSQTVTPDLIGRSPDKSPQKIDNKNFMHSPEALGHWSTTQGRIEIIDEEKDQEEMDQFLLKDNNYNRSIKECPSEQEEDSFTLGASFDQRSSVNKRLSPQPGTTSLNHQIILAGPGSPNTFTEVSRLHTASQQHLQMGRANTNQASPMQKQVLFDIIEERSAADRGSKKPLSNFQESGQDLMSLSSSEHDSFYSQSPNMTSRK